jgi:FAD/FMN-containing dehydrogenase
MAHLDPLPSRLIPFTLRAVGLLGRQRQRGGQADFENERRPASWDQEKQKSMTHSSTVSESRTAWEGDMTQTSFATTADLQAAMTGTVAVPGDAAYEEACAIWNRVIDRRPAVVARCATSADVASALAFARDCGLQISVRGGGHNFAGFALNQDGLMIDLTPMKSVTVDVEGRRATCGGGTTWAEFDAATQAHGLAVPGGTVSHTGVAGLTLGGGVGWLSRRAGLSCDNLAEVEMVTADGVVRRAAADEHADLFWAVRGGGGNFGVVTSFTFDLIPVGPLVHLGLFLYRPEQARDMLRFARDIIPQLPDEYGVLLAGLNAPPEPFVPEDVRFTPVFAFIIVGTGDADDHARQCASVRNAVPPLVEFVTPIPYTDLQKMLDPSAPWGSLAYEKGVHLEELTDSAIEVIVEHHAKKTSPMSIVPLLVVGGAFGRRSEDATAFGGRRSIRYIVSIAAMAPTRELYDAERAWARAFWDALAPHSANAGGYVNFMSEYDADRVQQAYGKEKYERLSRIKAAYDPDNVFRLNANIPPA